eukprot:CAMPEP_0176060238 /NCGR_PEP_ID=MMETSP0120_2-20121206/30022_1 /TAXON_ID=160619 /ORGANISM="Kryptoperidinium foliaceum, Strain CCMP 1326" /LENGTH=85 /DNA_ID=CAMNT_0017393777 /DNA_START=366 /DNA_END=620 /DNA_ORIENTATION=-
MPLVALPLDLSDNVPRDRPVSRLGNSATLRPPRKVVHVKRRVEGLCPTVQVDAIEMEQVLNNIGLNDTIALHAAAGGEAGGTRER